MMNDAVRAFSSQFAYQPVIQGTLSPERYRHFVIVGMGGSHLAADLLQETRSDLVIRVHSDYVLPTIHPDDVAHTLVILSSYSGNTEEVLEVAKQARSLNLSLAAVAVGGALLKFARAHQIPFVELPNTGIQPRSAAAFSLRALMKLVGAETDLQHSQKLAEQDFSSLEQKGQELALTLRGKVPVIYASASHRSIAYNWKIKYNETAKIPAFYNVIPELNHNEMNGFDVIDSTRDLSEKFVFIFLCDPADHPQNKKRFAVLEKLYTARNLPVYMVELTGDTEYEKAARALVLADWTAVALADFYGTEAEQVPMVEEFKKLIA